MSGWRLPALNLVLPGAGLLIAGHLWSGLLLLIPSILVVGLALAAWGLASFAVALPLLGFCAGIQVALGAVASLRWWWLARRRHFDPTHIRALHREATIAYLQGRAAEAQATAKRLAAAAPEEAGAWRFLALVAAEAGDSTTARRADARALAIDER
jgi:membrane protein implicated in regulation of membrane protease activity